MLYRFSNGFKRRKMYDTTDPRIFIKNCFGFIEVAKIHRVVLYFLTCDLFNACEACRGTAAVIIH